MVADVLEHNPELNFYRAEIAAAKGERRTAAAWAHPELSTSVGQKPYLEAVEALLDTRREALEAGQELQWLTGLDFNAVQPTPVKSPNP
jgi:hypothetical protein